MLTERTGLDIDNVPGQAQIDVLEKIGPIFVDSGDVSSQDQVDEALSSLLEDEYATQGRPVAGLRLMAVREASPRPPPVCGWPARRAGTPPRPRVVGAAGRWAWSCRSPCWACGSC